MNESGWVEAMRQQQRVERALLLAARWDQKAGTRTPPGDYSEASILIRCRNLILRDCARELRDALTEEGP